MWARQVFARSRFIGGNLLLICPNKAKSNNEVWCFPSLAFWSKGLEAEKRLAPWPIVIKLGLKRRNAVYQ